MSGALAKALVAAQQEMPAVEKTARAVYGQYATLDHIIKLTRPVLNKHGLTITQWPTVTELGAPALRTTITHESGESDSSVMPLFMGKQDMQQLGSAITYARRYAWGAALGISSESDDDGATTVEKPRPDTAGERPTTAPVYRPEPPAQAATPPALLDTVVGFGKHKGKTIGALLDSERGYVEWLANSFDAKSAATLQVKQAAVAAINGGAPDPDDDVPF